MQENITSNVQNNFHSQNKDKNIPKKSNTYS